MRRGREEPMMPELSRRERQIGEAIVNQVVEAIPSPPTAKAVLRGGEGRMGRWALAAEGRVRGFGIWSRLADQLDQYTGSTGFARPRHGDRLSCNISPLATGSQHEQARLGRVRAVSNFDGNS